MDPEEEGFLRAAAEFLNSKLEEKQDQTGIRNVQDLLTMAAFDIAVAFLKLKDENELAQQKMHEINSLIVEKLRKAE
ncbi:cell division protein ZapA [Sediminitomix flava]|uniref:Cell division protein ZapA n=1 Tax=Sediminitomix flava TaxID=379075 RepID=A0A315ZHD8_SEDFL|nr:cell division protein ZapA [Sediminitomix flava]